MTISLALICAPTNEEAVKLDRCLASAKKHVDDIQVTITGENKACEDVCKAHGANVSRFEWVQDFAKARNYNFAQCKSDWILWLDADDILRGGEYIREHVKVAEENKCSGIQFYYEYLKDGKGNVIDGHWRTQLIKNNGHAQWVGSIHETLIPNRQVMWAKVDDVVRVHTATKADNDTHHERNLVILEKEMKEKPDEPRTYIYAGRAYLALKRYEDALKVLSVFIQTSGWDEERYEAKCLMGECYERMGLMREAIMAYNDALMENEKCPYAHVYKARVYVAEEKWIHALTCLNQSKAIVNPVDGVMHRPMLMEHDAPALASLCYLYIGKYEEAYKTAEYIYNRFKNEHDKTLMEISAKMLEDERITQTFADVGKYLNQNNKKHLPALLSAVPAHLLDDPRINALRKIITPSAEWEKNSIAIFCGHSAEEWIDGDENGKGIGGSETAVIELSKRLVKKGWKITVYNGVSLPPEGREVNGVVYKNVWTFNKKDQFDVLWLWRMPVLLDVEWNARKVILDMHDVGNPEDFTPERLARVDHIFLKTQYHRSLYPQIPEEKCVVVGNGIHLARFDFQSVRNRHKIVYSSAPNRGLEHILEWWADIRKAIPQAELHVFYGWETFMALEKNNPKSIEWAHIMMEKIKQDGITYHGRVGQKELAKEILSSGVWLYPTEFAEIHCITACEMQAGGAYPITSGFAALEETQLIGDRIPVTDKDAYIQAIKKAMTEPIDRENIQRCAQAFSWDNVVEVWNNTL